ncbi:Crp/Fnr family transcriptional regulator [Catenulispora subtropica]|uniref:Crp/Fnr family transcriptional regulator n=1 Tax=Catenulispora subtropica TaxID=450798 RepID=A0ABP5ENI6_9ACTN
MDPYERFAAFTRRWVPGMPDEELEPARRFRVAKVEKGEYLARAGDADAASSFILDGLVRQVFSGRDGRERVNSFGTADTLVCPYRAALTTSISDLAIQALERTWYLAIPPGVVAELGERHAGWRDLLARLTEMKFVTAELRNRTLLLDDATERYRSFLEQYAAIAPRIPLSQVAAYIGVTPEALSRIRRRTFVTA